MRKHLHRGRDRNERTLQADMDGNPHAPPKVRFQRRFSINVWAGIVNDRLVGPYVLPNRLNANF